MGTDDDDWDDDAPTTGHDLHFLERLNERSGDLDVADLALRLYRDGRLVRAILATEHPAADRVALPLGPGAAPHAIVARSGAFVTCLGADMAVTGTPAVSFDRLQIHLGRAEREAERTARIGELLTSQRAARLLLEGADAAGTRLSREHFAQLVAVAPVLEPFYRDRLRRAFLDAVRAAPHVRRLKRLSPHHEPRLRKFWNRFHAVGHFILLSTVGGKRSFEFYKLIPAPPPFETIVQVFFEPVKLSGAFAAMRALVALSRGGELIVPEMKRRLAAAQTVVEWLFAAYALIAVGRRHRKLRSELRAAVGPARMPPLLRAIEGVEPLVRNVQNVMDGRWVEEDAPAAVEEQRMQGFAETIARYVGDRANTAGQLEELPGDDLSFARLAAMDYDFNSLEHSNTAAAVSLCASVPPEKLYFPAEFLAQAPEFTPERAVALAGFAPAPPAPARAEAKPGRNDPCTCGSGRKYQRCHGTS